MKKTLSGFILGVFLMFALSFTSNEYKANQSTAETSKIDGFYIFTDSKPVMPFDSLGVVDLGFVSGTQYESIRTNFIKRARKKYPTADGLILNLNKKGLDNCNVIKFK
jgi:hypothetical protein